MSQMNMIQAVRSALDVMMHKDPTVVILGQDIGYFGVQWCRFGNSG